MLKGKTALVTGSTSGIGLGIAKALAAQGANIVLNGFGDVEGPKAEVAALGVQVGYHGADMSKPAEIEAMIAYSTQLFGSLDILVNNAATNPYFGPMIHASELAYDKTFEVNVKGYFAATRAVAKHLIERGSPGAIVNVASVVGFIGSPMQGVYAMTKAAVISMTKTLAMELGTAGIRVNAIAPGLVDT